MKYVANREDYLNAVENLAREWDNYVTITDGVHAETYTSADIKITVPFADDTLSMGKSFTKELNLKIYEPERTIIYNLAKIKVYSKLKVGENYTEVQMGEYFPSDVTTNDDYQSLEIKAYDFMGKLDVPFEPDITFIKNSYWESGKWIVQSNNAMQMADSSCIRLKTMKSVTGDMHFVNNSGTTVWVTRRYSNNGVSTWEGMTSSDNTINKIVDGGELTLTATGSQYYYITVLGDYNLGLTCNGDEVAPYTVAKIMSSIQNQYGFTRNAFPDNIEKIEITQFYECTVAEMLGYLAGLNGQNAVFKDNGYFAGKWYTTPSNFAGRWLDYPIAWQDANFTWQSMNKVATIDRNEQKESGVKINEGTFTIASITSGTENNPLTVGEGKGIAFECPYMTQDLLTTIGNRELGKSTTIGEVSSFGNPLFEVGDIVAVIDKNENPHTFFISKIEWDFTGGCSAVYTAIGNPDAEIEFSTESPTDKKISKVKTVIQEVVTRFSNLINSLVGYYTITEENGVPTGWTIKDDLNNPQNMIKCSLGGIGISDNGGQTYKTAITGEGIVADTITSGTLTLGGVSDDTILEIKDTGGNDIGSWNSNGLTAIKGDIGGWTIDANGLTNAAVRINSDGSSTIYTVADLFIIRGHIAGTTGFAINNAGMIAHYDFNGDGRVTAQDYITLKQLIGLDPG